MRIFASVSLGLAVAVGAAAFHALGLTAAATVRVSGTEAEWIWGAAVHLEKCVVGRAALPAVAAVADVCSAFGSCSACIKHHAEACELGISVVHRV